MFISVMITMARITTDNFPEGISNCRWCTSSRIRRIANGAKARWIVEEPSSSETSYLLKCEDCNLVYFSASFSEGELSRMYSGYRSVEYQRIRSKYEPWYTQKINDAIGHSADVLNEIKEINGESATKVLADILSLLLMSKAYMTQ